MKTLFRLTALALAFVLPVTAYSADKKEDKSPKPTVVVRLQSVDQMMKSANFIANLITDEDTREQVKQAIDLVDSLKDPKNGIEGVDTTKPFGMYATLSAEITESPIVVLLPVANKDLFLNLLKQRAMLEVNEKDGVYSTTPEGSPFTVYFRFSKGYAWATINTPGNIAEDKLPKPEAVLEGKPEHLVSVSLHVSRLPEEMRNLALGFVENALADAKDSPIPGEIKSLKPFVDSSIDEVAATVKSLLNETGDFSINLNVDSVSKEIAVELELTPVASTKLAKDILSISQNKSVVGGAIAGQKNAFSFVFSVTMAKALQKQFPTLVDDVLAEAKKQAPAEVLEIAQPLIDALLPTLKEGQLDIGSTVVGPNKDQQYTSLTALKVKDGKKIERAVKDVVAKLDPNISALFELNAFKIGDHEVHVVKVADMLPLEAQAVLGKSDVMLAVRDDMLLITLGPDAKSVLKTALESKPADVGIMNMTVSMSRFATLMADSADTPVEADALKKAAKTVFKGKYTTGDAFTMSITGGSSFKVKFAIQEKALQYLIETGRLQEMGDN